MSTILNALKQAEIESPDQEDKNRPSFNIRSALNSPMQHKKPTTFLSLGRVVIFFALVVVLILFSYDFFFNNKNNYHQLSSTDKRSQVLETLPDIAKDQKPTFTESVIKPSGPPDAPIETIPKPVTKSFNRSKPKNETVLKPESVNPIPAAKTFSNKGKRQKILLLKNDSLKIQAIAWAEEPASRIAVIDNRVLAEGDSVQGYRLVIIEKNSVILHYSNNNYRLKFNHQ